MIVSSQQQAVADMFSLSMAEYNEEKLPTKGTHSDLYWYRWIWDQS